MNKIRRVLEISKVLARPKPENFNTTSGRCFKCVEAVVGKNLARLKGRSWTIS